jgi:CubicO group peptidase (beta-lactamase class C family)
MSNHLTHEARKALAAAGLSPEVIPLPRASPPVSLDLVPRPILGTAAAWSTWPLVGQLYWLDAKRLADNLEARLAQKTVGYAFALAKTGRVVQQRAGGWARKPDDGAVAWTTDVLMQIASVSKLVTAMAMTKLLQDKGVDPKDPIGPWLPAYWTRHPKSDAVTFAQLLTHTSGFNIPLGDTGKADIATIKEQVALGPQGPKEWDYKNLNFSVCRFLLATLNGNIAPTTRFRSPGNIVPASFEDNFWDAIAIDAYTRYVNVHLFAPAGIPERGFAPESNGALAYAFTKPLPPWNSGDRSSDAGSAGWRMSVIDVLKVMNAFIRRGRIVSPSDARTMVESLYGIDGLFKTNIGLVYWKNGRDSVWVERRLEIQPGIGRRIKTDLKTEQTVAFFLPRDFELVVFVNSPVGAENLFLEQQVADVINESIEFYLKLLWPW